MPGSFAELQVTLPEAPKEHLGKIIENDRIGTLAALYVEFLAGLVKDATKVFKD